MFFQVTHLKKRRFPRGFTLVELLVYIGIVAIVLVFIIAVGQNLVLSRVRANGQHEVYFQARTLLNHITQHTRNADGILTGSSTFNTHPGILTLDYPGSNTDVIFDTYTQNLPLPDGGVFSIRTLRMKEGSGSYQDLTNNQVHVTNFIVRNLRRGTEPANIQIELSLDQPNPSNDPDYSTPFSVETAVSIRK